MCECIAILLSVRRFKKCRKTMIMKGRVVVAFLLMGVGSVQGFVVANVRTQSCCHMEVSSKYGLRYHILDEDSDDASYSKASWSRRNLLLTKGIPALATTTLLLLPHAKVLAVSLDPSIPTSKTATTLLTPEEAVVTDKVFFDVRISRQDGTFYVRDDLPNTVENQVFRGRLTVGLFGKTAPNHVQRFLSYIQSGYNPLDDNPLPSYSRSVFPIYDSATGVLYGGSIPSLEVTELQGSVALQYGGRLLPAKLWVNAQEQQQRIRHSSIGLLTHKNLDVTPVFGITTRNDTSELESTHTVFGKLYLDDNASAFLQRVSELPVYSTDRPMSTTERDDTIVDDAAKALYTLQRNFFRGAAQNLGDTRIEKLVEGKLLRRVEVTQVGVL